MSTLDINIHINTPVFSQELPREFKIAESSHEGHIEISFDPVKDRFPTELIINKLDSISNYTRYGKMNLNLKSSREGDSPYFIHYRLKPTVKTQIYLFES